MHRGSRHIFFLISVLCSFAVFSQQRQTVVDTVVSMNDVPVVEEKDTATFSLAERPALVAVRSLPAKRLDSLKSEDDFWYANAELKKEKLQAEKQTPREVSLFQRRWFRDLLWIIILCSFLAAVLWYLASSNILIFRRNAKKIIEEEALQDSTDDIFAVNYGKEIARAEQVGNFRLAVRLHYLESLKQLAEQELIDYRFGHTNSDYVAQLHASAYYRDFFRLTRNFEYTWYGQFEPSAGLYSMMQQDFSTFKNRLRG